MLYPELNRFETAQDREAAMLAVGRAYSARWQYPATILAFELGGIAFGVAVAEGTLRLIRPLGHGVDGAIRAIMMVTCFAIALALLGRQYRNRTRRELRRILAGRGVPICVPCGYNLTGNVSGRCPECGTIVQSEFKARQ